MWPVISAVAVFLAQAVPPATDSKPPPKTMSRVARSIFSPCWEGSNPCASTRSSHLQNASRTAAVVSVFGLATASIVHAVAAAFGLSALFAYSPIAFDVIKYCGAAYLIYLGVSGFFKGGIGGIIARADNNIRPSLVTIYWQGLLTDLLNPKLLLFFFSFLPQFVDPTRGEPRVQMLVLGFVFQLTGVPTNLAVAFAGGALADYLRAARPGHASRTGARVRS
jgi:threonine/homoserine/homoserine lactone efflux protein